ncbi:Sec-independent protein translocase subunit TatA/TatB [Microbacterium sp. NPDC055903]
MFGLTIEKLFLVALVAAVIIGPHRLPAYAARLATMLRRLKDVAGEARKRAEEDSGVALVREDWSALDPRQYDPRRIIRDVWQSEDAAPEHPPVEPAGRWVVTGSSAHPRRVWMPADPVSEDEVLAASS